MSTTFIYLFIYLFIEAQVLKVYRPNVFRGLDSRTGLADWTHALTWKQLLNNNPGIIHLLQHWRHHYRVTTADTALPYKLTN